MRVGLAWLVPASIFSGYSSPILRTKLFLLGFRLQKTLYYESELTSWSIGSFLYELD